MTALQGGPVEISKAAKSLPESLWVRYAELVAKYKPVGLAEGYPDTKEVVPDKLISSLIATQSPDSPALMNQYPRSQGHPELVKELACLYSGIMGREIDAMTEVLITVGADESILCILKSILNPGDEVIIIEPFYVGFETLVQICDGVPRFVPLRMKPGGISGNDFYLDEDELNQAFTAKTRAIIVNSPHNPTGKVFSRTEITFIADLCKRHNCLYISDEVYEWLQYGTEYVRVASLPGMWERSVTIGSAGKTFSVTGWKIGWTIGPNYLLSPAAKVHASTVFCVASPLQVALADTFREERQLIGTEKSYWHRLVQKLKINRDKLYKILCDVGFRPIMPDGGYFIMADVSELGIDPVGDSEVQELDKRIVEWMIIEKGLATIPVSAFQSGANKLEFDKYIRFCFIKDDKTIDAAAEKLKCLMKK